MSISTSGLLGKGKKRSTLGFRRSKVKPALVCYDICYNCNITQNGYDWRGESFRIDGIYRVAAPCSVRQNRLYGLL